MVSLITCIDKDMLTWFFFAVTHWPPWTDGLTDWPSAYRGQKQGSPHQVRGLFNLPAPQITTNSLLLSLIYFLQCVFFCLCPFSLHFSLRFKFALLSFPSASPLPPVVFIPLFVSQCFSCSPALSQTFFFISPHFLSAVL